MFWSVNIEDVKPQHGFLVGIDTGGTFTDAVVCDSRTGAVAFKTKVPTNHDDLGACVSTALGNVIDGSRLSAEDIGLVSISTTLATNAIVEGAGRPAGLITIGFDETAIDRGGLRSALGEDPVISLRGGHSSHGLEVNELDLDALRTSVLDIEHRVDAFAVVGAFSVRNSDHERAAEDIIRQISTKPVTCSYELSEQLNGPKRAVTALLNARLIALTDGLLTAVEESMDHLGLTAPLMVMRGDGSLVSASFVRQRPIETILSGPAASALGSVHLAGIDDAIVADIGGTTTDVAVLVDGQAEADIRGAVVGGNATMINALRVHTEGIGGDSHVQNSPLNTPELSIGPRRVVPLVVAGESHAGLKEMLETQSKAPVARETDGMYLWFRDGGSAWTPRSAADHHVMDALSSEPSGLPYDQVIDSGLHKNAANRLLAVGVLGMAGFTPTDAMHVLGKDTRYETNAAELGAGLLARQSDRFGVRLAKDPIAISDQVYRSVAMKLAMAILAATFDYDDLPAAEVAGPLMTEALSRSATQRTGTLSVHVGVESPLVAVGAPAALYFPEVARLLRTDLIIPDHSEVANAVGAATGNVRLTTRVTVTAPRRGLFRVHSATEPKTFYELSGAQEFAEGAAREELGNKMALAGAETFDIENSWVLKEINVKDRPLFVEAVLTSTAYGHPLMNAT